MKILAIDKISSTNPAQPHIPDLLKAEIAKVWDLYTADIFREIYFRKDRPGAVLVLECASIEDARAALETLPLVREKLIEFDLIPLGPFYQLSVLFEVDDSKR